VSLPEPEGLTRRQLRSHRLAVRLLIPLLILLAAIVTPLYLLYDVGKVDGPSMQPTLENAEYLLITRGWSSPRRGDVVVVRWSHDGTTEELVKRIVALPGDTVAVEGDHVTVNGAKESFTHRIIVGPVRVRLTVVVPPDTVFVCGDNRANSLDSRFIGPLPLSGIHGRVVAVWAPVDRMRVIPSP
jgi:signal peptidase I